MSELYDLLVMMAVNEIKDSEIRDYLLGTGDDTRSEVIEELTFTEEGFAERVDTVENDFVDSYVDGTLGAPDRRRFESHYLSTPRRRHKVTFARTFAEFPDLPQARASPPAASEEIVSRTGWWLGLFAWQRAVQISFAALAVVFVAFVWWLMQSAPSQEIAVNGVQPSPGGNVTNGSQPGSNSVATPVRSPAAEVAAANDSPRSADDLIDRNDPRGPIVPGKAASKPQPKILAVVLRPPVRSGAVPAVTVPANVETVAFTLELESTDFRSYAVELTQQAGTASILRRSGLRTRSKRPHITFSIPSKLLNPQVYIFTVKGIAETGQSEIIGDYPFKVVQ